MPSYLITGAARGIGYAFVTILSADPKNTVIGLVRNKAESEQKAAEDLKRSNVHFIQGDMTDYNSLKSNVDVVSKITGGSLDYIIANAGIVPAWDCYSAIGDYAHDPAKAEACMLDCFKIHVIGNVHLFNLYLPLIRQGQAKKCIVISSGMADDELTRNFGIVNNSYYSISKSASNTVVAKFSAQYAEEGVLFLSVCPGTVEVGHWKDATEKDIEALTVMGGKFAKYAPDFERPATPEESANDVLNVIHNASLAAGNGGSFLSHYGTKKWLGPVTDAAKALTASA